MTLRHTEPQQTRQSREMQEGLPGLRGQVSHNRQIVAAGIQDKPGMLRHS